jgi:hypothetical protein
LSLIDAVVLSGSYFTLVSRKVIACARFVR